MIKKKSKLVAVTLLYTMFVLLCILVGSFLTKDVDSARILGIFPMTSVSHQVVFRALTYELAKNGHELVIVTPDPGLPKERPPDNITEIDISYTYETHAKYIVDSKNLYRGVVLKPENIIKNVQLNLLLYLAEEVMNNKELNEYLEDKNKKFDLILAEALFHFPMMYSKKYDIPLIWFSSFYGFALNFNIFGAPSTPSLYPNILKDQYGDLSLFDQIYQAIFDFRLRIGFFIYRYLELNVIQNKFGDETPSLSELFDQLDLMFINTNPIFEIIRPVPPNVVYLGGLHLEPVKNLPTELLTQLDNSKRGVIYVSLGTNIKLANMDPDLLNEFIRAFEALPYDILWKFDGENLPNVPKNVLIKKWFPQRDLLYHPNIKAFITQGGLQSTDEAIDAGIPLVGLPGLADQWFNVERYVVHKIGVKLDLGSLKAKDLVDAVTTVINDESYRRNIARLKTLMSDQPQTPLERAVWWTEYVIRNRGAKHLRSAAFNKSLVEYYMLDILAIMLVILLVSLYILVRLTKCCLRYCRSKLKRD